MKQLILALTICLAFTSIGMAAEVQLQTTADSVTVSLDKNGSEYVRVIISETKNLNGVEYERTLPLMFFGNMVPAGKAIQAGDAINCIASYREFQGRSSYTALKMIE